jgi:hypothetical protein
MWNAEAKFFPPAIYIHGSYLQVIGPGLVEIGGSSDGGSLTERNDVWFGDSQNARRAEEKAERDAKREAH